MVNNLIVSSKIKNVYIFDPAIPLPKINLIQIHICTKMTVLQR